jgi:hypothetical protein
MFQEKIIGIYCLVGDVLKGIGHPEHGERRVRDSEIIETTPILSMQ